MSEDDSVKHEGKWTRADLPSWDKIREADDMAGNGLRSRVIDIALNEVVEHLNTHHPKPEQAVCAQSGDNEPMMPRETLWERAASDGRLWNQAYAEGVASAERTCNELRSLIEGQKEHVTEAQRERDKALDQWKKWEHKANEWKARADQLRDERDDAVQSCIAVGRERDEAVARADHAEKGAWRVRYQQAVADLLNAGRARDEWKARAEKAEADRENIAEEFADFRVEVVAEAVKYRESNPQASGDDPAVYVVRESDIAAVEIERDERGWHGPGTTWTERSTSGEVRAHAEGLVRNVARCEAVARAIEAEQAVDLIEEKAISAFKVAWHEADMRGDEGNRTRRGIRAARKVIEGDGE